MSNSKNVEPFSSPTVSDLAAGFTESLLIAAGITSGMHVLDIGCGGGDVAMTAARLVGGRGEVVGIDSDARALAAARQRAQELGFRNVEFREGDLNAPPSDLGHFDAVVGRRVLMYQSDPAFAMRQIAALARPGGVVAFQEHDATIGSQSLAPLPLHRQVHEWMWRTVEREGGDIRLGFKLASLLSQAALLVQQVRAEAVVQTPQARHRTAWIVKMMLSRIIERGVATAEEIDVETLDARLAKEIANADTSFIGELAFCAWARKPA